jgi:two-component system, NarL family, sensor histidine kinase DesK
VPFAVFGRQWQVGIGGLLAGLVLLSIAGWVSWLAASALLVADVAVRAALSGLLAPAWSGALWAALSFVIDAAVVFGMVRLAQLIGELHDARDQSAQLAAADERLHAAEMLQSAVGKCLADLAAKVHGDPCQLAAAVYRGAAAWAHHERPAHRAVRRH